MVVAELEEPVQPRAVPDRLVRLERVVAGGEHDEAAHEEREHGGDDRRDDPAGALVEREPLGDARRVPARLAARRLLGVGLAGRNVWPAHATPTRPPPVIAIPSSSSLTLGPYSPTMRPS